MLANEASKVGPKASSIEEAKEMDVGTLIGEENDNGDDKDFG